MKSDSPKKTVRKTVRKQADESKAPAVAKAASKSSKAKPSTSSEPKAPNRPAIPAKQNRSAARRALVKREDVRHGQLSVIRCQLNSKMVAQPVDAPLNGLRCIRRCKFALLYQLARNASHHLTR